MIALLHKRLKNQASLEAWDLKYLIVHLQIQIGVEPRTPMVQLVLFHRTKCRYYFGTTIMIGNLMFVFLNLFFLSIPKTLENFSFVAFHNPPSKKKLPFWEKKTNSNVYKFSLLSYVFFSSWLKMEKILYSSSFLYISQSIRLL